MYLKRNVFFSVCFFVLNCLVAATVCAGQDAQFTVQVETVSFEPAARAVVNRLNASGYDAYFESYSVADGKRLYKVRFGRFATRGKAAAAARAYKQQEQRNCFVVQTMLKAGPPTRTAAARPVQTSAPERDQYHEDGKEFYTFQIAAKADRTAAQKFVDRLQRKGYPAYLRGSAPGASKPLYRIRIGRYETRIQAEQAGRAYADREAGEYLVVLSPADRLQGAAGAEAAVTVAAAPKPVTVEGYFFTVQVCVCETVRAAESHAARVRAKGFDPYMSTYETMKGKILYRVRMGRFKERSRAVDLARAYELKGGRDFLVVRSEQQSASRNGHDSTSEPRAPALPQPVMDGQVLSQNNTSVQETELVESELAVSGQAGQAIRADGISSAGAVKDAAPGGSEAEPVLKSPANTSISVTKVYAYTGSRNELNLTNAHAKIPKDLLERIQYVSIFPVLFVAVPEKGSSLVMEIEGVRRLVALSGLRLPEDKRSFVSGGIKEVLSAEPLRLKYHPDDDHKDLLTATLYYRSGTDLQIELLKKGLALVDAETLPVARQASLRGAQHRAREMKAGIWSGAMP